MATVDQEPKTHFVETQPVNETLRPPVYNPRGLYGEYRFKRMIKFAGIGAVIGLVAGLAVGGLLSYNLDAGISAKAALTTSMGMAGGVIGVVVGIIAEGRTAPALNS